MKALFRLLFLFSPFLTFAQGDSLSSPQLYSRRGVPILPETGEYGLSLNAQPLFNYAGNFFNNTADNELEIGYAYQYMFVGKHFITPQIANRLKLGFSTQYDRLVIPYLGNPDETHREIGKGTDFLIGVGQERRRGRGRVQGLFGGEAYLRFVYVSTNYKYDRDLNDSDPVATPEEQMGPSGGRAIRAINVTLDPAGNATAIQGTGLSLGLRIFVGVEYFFAPKISIGTELGLSAFFTFSGHGQVREEFFTGGETRESVTKKPADKNVALGVGADNNGLPSGFTDINSLPSSLAGTSDGMIFLHFYF